MNHQEHKNNHDLRNKTEPYKQIVKKHYQIKKERNFGKDFKIEDLYNVEVVSIKYKENCEPKCNYKREWYSTRDELQNDFETAKYNDDRVGKLEKLLDKWFTKTMMMKLKESKKPCLFISEYKAYSNNLTHFIHKGRIHKNIIYIVTSENESVCYARCDEFDKVLTVNSKRKLPKNYLDCFAKGIFKFTNSKNYADIEVEANNRFLQKIIFRCMD